MGKGIAGSAARDLRPSLASGFHLSRWAASCLFWACHTHVRSRRPKRGCSKGPRYEPAEAKLGERPAVLAEPQYFVLEHFDVLVADEAAGVEVADGFVLLDPR